MPQGGALSERPQDLHTGGQLTTSQEPGALFIAMVLNPEEVGGAIRRPRQHLQCLEMVWVVSAGVGGEQGCCLTSYKA